MDLKKAAEAQRRLSSKLILKWEGREVKLVAGADFSYDKKKKKIGAGIVVLKIPEFEIIETSEILREIKFPYIPGFLALREAPAFFDAFQKIKNKPDVTLVDGNGIAHPRKMGLASFVGVLLDICTIGCAKTHFFPYVLPGEQRGAFTFFRNDSQEKVGLCLRTRTRVKPLFVSPGHKIDFMFSAKIVLNCSKFRVPEPLREAHSRASRMFSSNSPI